MTRAVRLRLVSVGIVIGLFLAAAEVADADPPPWIDASTVSRDFHFDPKGQAPGGQYQATATTSDSGGAGSISLGGGNASGQGAGTSGASTGSSGTGGSGGGGVTTCVEYLIITDTIPLPALGVDSGPPVNRGGVVGVPTWFWAQNFSGDVIPQPPIHALYHYCDWHLAADGVTWEAVEHTTIIPIPVTVWATHYAWDFGDRQRAAGSCGGISQEGNCPPGALGVKDQGVLSNIYQASSTGYPVKLAVDFVARLGGAGGQAVLGPYTQGVTVMLPVREVQSVLVPNPAP